MFQKQKNSEKKIFPAVSSKLTNINQQLISVINKEKNSLEYLIKNFPINSELLVEQILKTSGRIVFSGMGKSGFVAKKLVATFSSLGTPALFVHPAEALHGDLGMILSQDLFIALSKSGTGAEFAQILPILKSKNIFTVLIACSNGELNKIVDLDVVLPFETEACFLNLAPTSSSTLCLAFGDALAVVVSNIKNFSKNDFASFHPAGALGKNLLLKVCSLMHKSADLPILDQEDTFKDLLLCITKKKLGVGIVVNKNKKLLGIITDGDLRRACEVGAQAFDKKAKNIMNSNPKVISQDVLASHALAVMENFNITSLVVVDNNNIVIGLIHIHDLIKVGIFSN